MTTMKVSQPLIYAVGLQTNLSEVTVLGGHVDRDSAEAAKANLQRAGHCWVALVLAASEAEARAKSANWMAVRRHWGVNS